MSPEARKAYEDMMNKMGGNAAIQSAQQAINTDAKSSSAALQRSTDPDIIPDKMASLKIATTLKNKGELTAFLPSAACYSKVITIAFRNVTDPGSLRILISFTRNFDFGAMKKMVD
jgi:hypothetical protein